MSQEPVAHTRAMSDRDRHLLERIRNAVRALEPAADVILYGSRARGEADPESDWDLVILVDGPVAREREYAFAQALFELGLETDSVLVPIVHSREEWDSPIYRAMPFRENVEREGVVL